MSRGESKKATRKGRYWNLLSSLLEEYNKILVVTADNVGSSQMQQIRRALRGKATLLMGKNTMAWTVIRNPVSKNPRLEALLPYVKGNTGFIFTNGDLSEISTQVLDFKVRAAAKAGTIAPADIILPAGDTRLEPSKTSFFQALSIPSRINRGAVEITNDIHLIKAGQKINLSQAALLQMLGTKPFEYGLKITTAFEDGSIRSLSSMAWTIDDLFKSFLAGVANVAALSLSIGLSVPNGFKNLAALSLETSYSFPAAGRAKAIFNDPAALVVPSVETTAESIQEDPNMADLFGGDEDEEEEEGDADMVDLFGGDEE